MAGTSGTGTNQWSLYTGPGVSNGFGFDNNGSTRLFINTSGNVGIGTTAPGYPLDVNGSARATSFITSGGTASQFVKGDGSLDSTAYQTAYYGYNVPMTQTGDWVGMTTQSGIADWTHVINMEWGLDQNNWVSQIAVSAQDDSGMYYRSIMTGTPISSKAWRKVLDSSNYSSYALPLKVPPIATSIAGATDGAIDIPEVSVGSTPGFVTALRQTTTYSGGYRQYLSLGDYRTAAQWGGGFFVGLGGNDNNPTDYYLLGYGGSISYSTGAISTPGTLTVAGNVGIGTAGPVAKLEVESSAGGVMLPTVLVGGNGGNASITINSAGTSNYAYQTFAQGGTGKWEMGATGDGNGNFYLNPNIQGGYANAAFFIYRNGNIGIGTTGPTTKLQVSASTANDGISIVSNGILSGQSTEVTGQLTNFEYNYNRLGAQNTTYVGGAFTIDSRTPATTLFHWRYRSTAGVESEVMDLGSTGNLSIPGAFSASQLNVISAGVASYFQGGAGGYSALSFSGDSGTTVASLTTLSGAILIGSRNAGGTGSNGEIAIKSGSVGIGNTSPSSLLSVGSAVGSTQIDGSGNINSANLTLNGTSGWTTNSVASLKFGNNVGITSKYGGPNDLIFSVFKSGATGGIIGSDSLDVMKIAEGTGNVSIGGSTANTSSLYVQSDSNANAIYGFNQYTNGIGVYGVGRYAGVEGDASGGSGAAGVLGFSSGTTGQGVMANSGNIGVESIGTTYAFYAPAISSNGPSYFQTNVGIGIAPSTAALDVSGAVKLESVTVGQALCLTSAHQIGHCTSAVNSSGACTCAAN